MTEYIFYTTEGFTEDPKGEDIENCQLMGRAYGNNQNEALDNLLKENPWIEKQGFDPGEFICQELASTSHSEDKLSYLTNLLTERQLEKYIKWLDTIE